MLISSQNSASIASPAVKQCRLLPLTVYTKVCSFSLTQLGRVTASVAAVTEWNCLTWIMQETGLNALEDAL